MNKLSPILPDLDFPEHIDIDLSNRCNLRCDFCYLSYFDPKSTLRLTVEEFERVEPALHRLRSITLFSKFEPLTCPDFLAIFERVAAHPVESYFSSNGILLSDEIIEGIVGRLTFLTISVTGFDRESYKRHMGQDHLETVRGNLARLNAAKKRLGTDLPRLRLSTVAMQSNLEGLPSAVDFANEFDMSEGVQVCYLTAFDPKQVSETPAADMAAFKSAVGKAATRADDLGVTFNLQGGMPDDIEAETAELGHKWCDMPWRRLSLQPNGDVYPCPLAYEPIGNFFEESLDEIWASERLATFRKGVNCAPEEMNHDCRVCSHCRTRSVEKPAGIDFSESSEIRYGMTRKKSKGAV
ncbi:MAG: radical SAM/SPASM domain-containing protein [Magnetovibrionaceae bacterium]